MLTFYVTLLFILLKQLAAPYLLPSGHFCFIFQSSSRFLCSLLMLHPSHFGATIFHRLGYRPSENTCKSPDARLTDTLLTHRLDKSRANEVESSTGCWPFMSSCKIPTHKTLNALNTAGSICQHGRTGSLHCRPHAAVVWLGLYIVGYVWWRGVFFLCCQQHTF